MVHRYDFLEAHSQCKPAISCTFCYMLLFDILTPSSIYPFFHTFISKSENVRIGRKLPIYILRVLREKKNYAPFSGIININVNCVLFVTLIQHLSLSLNRSLGHISLFKSFVILPIFYPDFKFKHLEVWKECLLS